jgi:hypothetical protein
VRLSQRAAAVAVLGRAGQQSLRATTASTKLRHVINQGQKVAGRENQRVLLLEDICLEEPVRSHHQYGIGMIGTREAQASWGAFLMIVFAMTSMKGAQAAWSAPHETVVATMITETAAHTFHHDIERDSPITGMAHRAALIIRLVGGLSMRTSETELQSVMIDHHLNVVGLLTVMKQARRAGVLSLKTTT